MQNINIYDVEAEDIEKVCEEKSITVPELIEALMTALNNGDIDIDNYLWWEEGNMDKNFREYLGRQLKEAREEFEAAKQSAIKDLESMQYYQAIDFGAAYYTKIDRVTKAETRVQEILNAMRAYEYFEPSEEKEES